MASSGTVRRPGVIPILLAAILGALSAVAYSRWIAPPSSASGQEAAAVDAETAALLPPNRFSCEEGDLDAFQNPNPHISLSVVANEAYTCHPAHAPRGLQTVYTQFTDATGDRRYIDAQADQAGIRFGDDCRDDGLGYQHWFSDQISGSHELGPPSRAATANGRVLCYRTPDDRYWVEWTDPGAKAIYGQASLPNARRLFAWWAKRGGPVHR